MRKYPVDPEVPHQVSTPPGKLAVEEFLTSVQIALETARGIPVGEPPEEPVLEPAI